MDNTTAFSRIAPHYDALMSDVDYVRWFRYIEELLAVVKKRPRRVLDLACGTGILSLMLAHRDYDVVGLDISEPMLKTAQQKQDGLKNLRFIRGDMTDFVLDEKVDAVFSIFDSLNYLLEERHILSTFECARKALNAEGVFLFDMNTIHCLRHYWGNKTQIKESGGLTSIWKTRYDPSACLSTLTITLLVAEAGRPNRRIEEIHYERGYSVDWVVETLHDSGFDRVYAFDHLTKAPPNPDTLRVTYLAF
jgi:SAM-dependent methyltransferase